MQDGQRFLCRVAGEALLIRTGDVAGLKQRVLGKADGGLDALAACGNVLADAGGASVGAGHKPAGWLPGGGAKTCDTPCRAAPARPWVSDHPPPRIDGRG